MATVVGVGAQWGDEGKGKIVDWLAPMAQLVVRFQGGNNAGHTLVVDGEQTVLHVVPAGVLNPATINVIGPGVVVDPGVGPNRQIICARTKDHVFIAPDNGILSWVLARHEPIEIRAEGLRAVCFQHEVDHLDGILFIDHLSRLKRGLYVKRRKKQIAMEEVDDEVVDTRASRL